MMALPCATQYWEGCCRMVQRKIKQRFRVSFYWLLFTVLPSTTSRKKHIGVLISVPRRFDMVLPSGHWRWIRISGVASPYTLVKALYICSSLTNSYNQAFTVIDKLPDYVYAQNASDDVALGLWGRSPCPEFRPVAQRRIFQELQKMMRLFSPLRLSAPYRRNQLWLVWPGPTITNRQRSWSERDLLHARPKNR